MHATKILKFRYFHQNTLYAIRNFFEKLLKKIPKHSLLTEFHYYLCHTKYINDSRNWRRRYYFEFYKLFRDVDIIKFIKLDSMRWASHLMRMKYYRLAL